MSADWDFRMWGPTDRLWYHTTTTTTSTPPPTPSWTALAIEYAYQCENLTDMSFQELAPYVRRAAFILLDYVSGSGAQFSLIVNYFTVGGPASMPMPPLAAMPIAKGPAMNPFRSSR